MAGCYGGPRGGLVDKRYGVTVIAHNPAGTLANPEPPLLQSPERMHGHASTTRSTLAGPGWSAYARFYAWRFS